MSKATKKDTDVNRNQEQDVDFEKAIEAAQNEIKDATVEASPVINDDVKKAEAPKEPAAAKKSSIIQNVRSAELDAANKRVEEQTAMIEDIKDRYVASSDRIYEEIENRDNIRREMHRAIHLRDTTMMQIRILTIAARDD